MPAMTGGEFAPLNLLPILYKLLIGAVKEGISHAALVSKTEVFPISPALRYPNAVQNCLARLLRPGKVMCIGDLVFLK
ncbi:unnamed protein product [Protopolystoma xenopodis]|uniref:Uncharacterized protein n=1 Tax=Protopolystoma xenopodis TaxID=117903 RepID=A0A448XKU5_9PLAT|nr:unnamed protein product [Protopolystoma xenopodis]